MLDKRQHRLLKLMEECAEVAHRASKQILFGKQEIQHGQELTNAERLRGEVLDLLLCIRFCEREGHWQPITNDEVAAHEYRIGPKIHRAIEIAVTTCNLDNDAHRGIAGDAAGG
jgi:hypothetical protein